MKFDAERMSPELHNPACRRAPSAAPRLAGILVLLGAVGLAVPPAHAQMTEDDGCMQDVAGFGLNCTANDVQLSRATNITVLDDGCRFPGDMVTFEATFEVVLTAQERHDIGVFFATDGDPNMNGAISGGCTIATVPYTPDPPWLDLDMTNDGGVCVNDPDRLVVPSCTKTRECRPVGGACGPALQDRCGDIDAAHNPLFPVIQLTTACIDPDGDRKLNLPNCTSWRQPGANSLCLSPLDAFPGAPSKCRCDLAFEIDIDVPPANLLVTKTADPTSVAEPGATVRFDVTIENTSIDPTVGVTLDQLDDDIHGDLLDPANPGVSNNTCTSLDGHFLAASATVSCSFEAVVSGNAGDSETDTVTASGLDQRVPPNRVSGSDDATVTVTDVLPALALDKTASPTQVLEPGADVTFTVVVTNNSNSSDPVTITVLDDDIHGDLNGQGDCSVPQTIQPGASYSCSFTAFVGGGPGTVETDVATADGADDDGNPVSASDDATVNVNDVPSMIEIVKTASPSLVNEPGGDVTFSFTVTNRSLVDTVTIDMLTDTVYGDLTAVAGSDCAVPQVLAPSGSYSCGFTAFVAGNAGDFQTNVATASGTDDDGNPVVDDDSDTVNVANVAPSAELTKTASMADVTYDVVVTNTSVSSDPLELTELMDDIYGDVTVVQGAIVSTDCAVPQTIEAGQSYACSFVAKTNAPGATDTVTGTLADDDGSTPLTPSDSATVSLQ